MAKITTHVLDTSHGTPAAGVPVLLERKAADAWHHVGAGVTDDDGRLRTLTSNDGVSAGVYRITFNVESYFSHRGQESFYPEAAITFVVRDASQHFHVPLLLAPFGYTTYRGS